MRPLAASERETIVGEFFGGEVMKLATVEPAAHNRR
jgi:hypothetical protein